MIYNVNAYRAEHCSEGEESCHTHTHPARDRLSGDEEGEPGEDLEDNNNTDDDTIDILTTNTAEGMYV